jgi:hypothetical protein
MHWINSSRCDTTPVVNSSFFHGLRMNTTGPIRPLPIQVLTVPMLLNFCAQIEGTGVSTYSSLDFGILSALYGQATQCGHSCDMSSPTQSHPTPKPSSNSYLPVAWITGPDTDYSINIFCVRRLVVD